MPEINEWTFAADVCKTIQAILGDNPSLPFSEAKVEEPATAGRKRRDLTLYGTAGLPILTGEIKLPDRPDGQSPYSAPLLEDAFQKANAKGLEHFFTWNVNRFVLWKTFEAGKPIAERDLEHFNVTSITAREELSNPGVQTEIRGFLTQFLGRYARILEGTEPIRSKPLDEKFIRVLESALDRPISQTRNAIAQLYSTDRKFARNLDGWMRDFFQESLSTDPESVRHRQERAARLSCYILVNKIVFQQALRRRFPSLRKIRVTESIKTVTQLRDLFNAVFGEAKRISRDYETVFDGDFGDALPFLENATVGSWREFVGEIEGFDFSKIGYDIIGHIFERLISPEERHRKKEATTFLTSSAWLDTEYGFHLQEWLLRHFAILALFESNCEPWFTGARVTTVATLLRRGCDPAKRASNTVRFVQLRKPLKEVLESFDPDPLNATRSLRDFVENQNENLLDDRWRIRVVNQHDLWNVGCSGGVARQARIEATGAELFHGEYAGGKWGIYLRAPDIFFKLLDRCGSRLVPLGQLAEIRFGVKSGADDFFFVQDVTGDEIIKCSAGVALSKHQFGRFMGREGNLKTEVVDARMMLVPDPRYCSGQIANEISQAFNEMRKRLTKPLVEEFCLADRAALDDAVLKLLAYSSAAERVAVREELYQEMTRLYTEIRDVELEMQAFRRVAARRERASPRTIAEEIWEEFDKAQIRSFPVDFIPDGEATETVTLPIGTPKVLHDLFHKATLQVNGHQIQLGTKVRAEFAARLRNLDALGMRPFPRLIGLASVPWRNITVTKPR
jgi:hypothetical protein